MQQKRSTMKTRWQTMAENLFAVLLKVDRFESDCDRHLSMLARMITQVELAQDALLLQIIKYYFGSIDHQ